MFDVAIIGAGVIGAGISRELMKYSINLVILEKENDVSCGASKANSAIVHAGYDAPYNTLKGKFNKLGNDIFLEVCKELDVEFNRVGSYVIAFNDDDLKTLDRLKLNGEKLGVEGLKIIDGDTLRKKEKNLSKEIIAALYAKTAAITNPFGLTVAYVENAMDNGASLNLNFEVNEIINNKDHFLIKSKDKAIKAKCIVNAAGIYASDLYSLVTDTPEFEIKPRKGEYFLLDKSVKGLVNSIIFQCPTELGKGVLIIPTVHGNTMVGPNNKEVKDINVSTTRQGLDYLKSNSKKIIGNIPFDKNITNYSGLRAEPTNGDFIIEESKIENFFNVAGIKSPGLSSAPAIAKHVAGLLKDKYNLKDNPNFNPIRKGYINLLEKSDDQINNLIKKDSKYGNIVCRCENITEGEIIDSINRHCGARTINGVKRRVRPGSGRCQGSFCGPRVLEILARELKVDQLDICLESKNSNILISKTKDE